MSMEGGGDAAGLRYSPRLFGRPESTDFIGCFPLWSLRCQQQKNRIVAIVPSKSSNNSSTHWILYGLNRTKNAAAIIIRRDVGQIPQHQSAASAPDVMSLRSSRWGGRRCTPCRCTADSPECWYHCNGVQCMTQHGRKFSLFIFFLPGVGRVSRFAWASQ